MAGNDRTLTVIHPIVLLPNNRQYQSWYKKYASNLSEKMSDGCLAQTAGQVTAKGRIGGERKSNLVDKYFRAIVRRVRLAK